MDYKIVVGSSCDFNDELKKTIPYASVPFTLTVGSEDIVDDGSLPVKSLLEKMKMSANAVKTACPSPQHFFDKYKEAENIFVVTISSKLSGTYNSAISARNMYFEQFGEKFIHIFDSLSAVIAETLIAMKIKEAVDDNMTPSQVVDHVEDYIKGMKTLFVLENLDNLIKNGRMSRLAGIFAQLLLIKPILTAVDGEIVLVEKSRGSKNALKRMVELIGIEGDATRKRIGIIHCNAPEKAESVKNMIKEAYNFEEIVMTDAQGLGAVYMDNGGIVIAY
ncbi:MAG: DegV family protein [Eubacteriaceae bacterium]|nr:DegV family protein [Eubacteriaceae bacterium]